MVIRCSLDSSVSISGLPNHSTTANHSNFPGLSPHTINTGTWVHNLRSVWWAAAVRFSFARHLNWASARPGGDSLAPAVVRARDAPKARPPAFTGFRPPSGFCFAKTFLRSEPLRSLLAGAHSPPWRVPPGSGAQRQNAPAVRQNTGARTTGGDL